ncbi:hypothetical protein PK35_15150 [Tamlana nanhaiensis]|uniref:Uncharacterized protein n=1 Tax=Neotamlana nanhaiensis TaxID=1382798 RepID=A0A0D7VX74_9FLAO|nr:Ig-like domain-containing protein [Tamlana nanhaiensis]KJD31441.1 hypothetical protein PK35_15150 [Tamlana nanhaiensis]
MKNSKFIFALFVTTSLLVKCKCSDDEPIEHDVEAPVITIISPNNNQLYYPNSEAENLYTIVVSASATDNNNVKSGKVTITDENGIGEMHSENGYEVYTSFSKANEGVYILTFEFEDYNGNVASEKRIVYCKLNNDDTDAN